MITGGEATPAPHAGSHEAGEDDELDVTGLSGLLADEQDPVNHAADHQNGGGDEISVTGLSGLLADAQTVEIAKAGSLVGTRKRVNLIEGSNVTLTVTDNGGSDRVDVTVAASGGSSNERTYAVQTGGSSVATHPTKVDLPGLSAFSVSATGTYLLEVRGKFLRNPSHTTANLYCDVSVVTGSITKAQEMYWYPAVTGSAGNIVALTPSSNGPALPSAATPVYVVYTVQLQVTALASGAATFKFRFGSASGATAGDQIQCDDAVAELVKLT